MSGFAALYQRDGGPAADGVLAAMLDRLRHRGPDASGRRVMGPVGLGHCLLATTPEDVGTCQPLGSPTANCWIVADARLDNREELLGLRGSSGDVSDAALILWAYERWGMACTEHLLGDFAFVIWDGAARQLFCARDPLGVRPLYYHVGRDTFACASEMDALFADSRIPRKPLRPAVALFLARLYLERDTTLWAGILALPPGETLRVRPQSLDGFRYWRPVATHAPPGLGDAEHARRFGTVFGEAVRCRLRARGPVAAEVSGGLDSSSVACEAERLRRAGRTDVAQPVWLHLAFPGLDCDERRYSQAVAARWGLPLVTLYPMDDPALTRLETIHRDVPYDPTIRMFEPLLRAAQTRGIRTLLTGLGGDQLMQRTGFEATHQLRAGHALAAAREAGVLDDPLSILGWRKLLFAGIQTVVSARTVLRARRVRRPIRARFPWLARQLVEAALDVEERLAREAASLSPDPLLQSLCLGLSHGPDTVLVLALNDRFAAQFGVEMRHPFLDVRVIELLLALPAEQRFSAGLAKAVLRRAMRGTLPELVRTRCDPANFNRYITSTLEPHWPLLRHLLQRGRLEAEGFIEPEWVAAQLAAGPGASGQNALIRIAAMELWLRGAAQHQDHEGDRK